MLGVPIKSMNYSIVKTSMTHILQEIQKNVLEFQNVKNLSLLIEDKKTFTVYVSLYFLMQFFRNTIYSLFFISAYLPFHILFTFLQVTTVSQDFWHFLLLTPPAPYEQFLFVLAKIFAKNMCLHSHWLCWHGGSIVIDYADTVGKLWRLLTDLKTIWWKKVLECVYKHNSNNLKIWKPP